MQRSLESSPTRLRGSQQSSWPGHRDRAGYQVSQALVFEPKDIEARFVPGNKFFVGELSQLEKALHSIQILKNTDLNSEEFSQALADLHVCSTVLDPYSEGMVEAIDQFTESRTDD
jgi:hypothetical protein